MYRSRKTYHWPANHSRIVVLRRRRKALREAIRWLELYQYLTKASGENVAYALQKYLRSN